MTQVCVPALVFVLNLQSFRKQNTTAEVPEWLQRLWKKPVGQLMRPNSSYNVTSQNKELIENWKFDTWNFGSDLHIYKEIVFQRSHPLSQNVTARLGGKRNALQSWPSENRRPASRSPFPDWCNFKIHFKEAWWNLLYTYLHLFMHFRPRATTALRCAPSWRTSSKTAPSSTTAASTPPESGRMTLTCTPSLPHSLQGNVPC